MSEIGNAYPLYLSALRQHNRSECFKIIEELIDRKVPAVDIYLDLIRASMYEIGNLWEKNEISVTEEHLASAITEGIINTVLPRYQIENKNGKFILLACAKQEQHQIGIKIVADIFELGGWESQFVGVDLSAEMISEEIENYCPDVLAFSISLFFNISGLKKVLNDIRERYPNLKIIVGGLAANQELAVALSEIRNCFVISSFGELDKIVKD